MRWRASPAVLVLAASLYWLLTANAGFVSATLATQAVGAPARVGFGLALAAIVVALHLLLVLPLAGRHTVKPLLALLTLVAVTAAYFGSHYGVVIDPDMMRNVLHTDAAEAAELLNLPLLLHLLLFVGLPLGVLARVEVVRQPWRHELKQRAGLAVAALLLLVVAVAGSFQPLASAMRNHKVLRYRIAPANVLWSGGAALLADTRRAVRPRTPIGLDARPGPSWATATRPRVLVLVVGETARAANWGLAGYARPTTPQLAALPVIDFGPVQACGTSTEVSLPCLFAPVGRRDYDEARIRGQDSLLHLLARAGVAVHWRDNQSGCKGVCDGLPGDHTSATAAAGLCAEGRCLDEALIVDLDARLAAAQGTQIWVLHMLGNHGPSYFRRYPETFATFGPACRDDELGRCTPAQVVNAYDNALRYTDHVLASAIRRLQAHAGQVDSALLFVSDHGESLGEYGLFLHGLPYALAPAVQREVPMLLWRSDGYDAAVGLRPGCLSPTLRARAAAAGLSHDHVFHTVLGLLDVRTALHEPAWDLSEPCR